MALPANPKLIDSRILKAQSHPIRAHILNMLCDGPTSPGRMQRRMENVSLSLVCHHVKVLRDVGLIELVEVKKRGGRKGPPHRFEHRLAPRPRFDAEDAPGSKVAQLRSCTQVTATLAK